MYVVYADMEHKRLLQPAPQFLLYFTKHNLVVGRNFFEGKRLSSKIGILPKWEGISKHEFQQSCALVTLLVNVAL